MDFFVDGPDSEASLRRIIAVEGKEATRDIIEELVPGWLKYSLSEYSPDYPHLQKNWEIVVGKIGVNRGDIVLVHDIVFDDDHKLIRGICEHLTRKGYCVRRVSEFNPCPGCMRAIPCIEVWHLLKEKKMPVPAVWSKRCKECSE